MADPIAADEGWDDRRDSARVPIRLMVRDPNLGGSYEERSGNLALGGVYFAEGHPPVGNRLEVRFLLPGTRQEIRACGEVLRVTRDGADFGTHLRFEDLPLDDALAIARFLENP
jgi:hypothetical protein